MYMLEQAVRHEQFPEDTERRYLEMIKSELGQRYAEYIGNEIQKAYLESYNDYGQNLFDRYLDYADAWVEDHDFKDPDTGQMMDRELLNPAPRKIEKPAGIAKPKDIRTEVRTSALRARAQHSARNPPCTPSQKTPHPIARRMAT